MQIAFDDEPVVVSVGTEFLDGFTLRGGIEDARTLIDALELFSRNVAPR
jgi:hypothetical protein